MNILTIVLGILCIGYGIYTAIMRAKAPEKFGKLEAMKKKFGDKAGQIVHIVSYTIVPILVGVAFFVSGLFGLSLF
jgi:hypothetical protein